MNADAPGSWHIWAVGLLGAAWNAFGCYIYTMAMIRDPDTLAAAPPAMVAALEAAPAWSNGAWAFGVWGGLTGCVLLLLRSRFAVAAFCISLAGLIGSTTYEVLYAVPVDRVQQATIWLMALALLGYALFLRRRGLLR